MGNYSLEQKKQAVFKHMEWCEEIKRMASEKSSNFFIQGSCPILASMDKEEIEFWKCEYRKLK